MDIFFVKFMHIFLNILYTFALRLMSLSVLATYLCRAPVNDINTMEGCQIV